MSEELQKQLEDLQAKMKEQSEEIDRLRSTKDTLLDEKKKEQQKAREAAEEAERKAREKAEADGDYKQLLADSERRRQEAEESLNQLQLTAQKSKHQAEALKLAAALTSDSKKAEILAAKYMERTKYADGQLKVLDKDGQLTVSPVETLTDDLKANYAFLVDGSKASGGGANGSGGSKGGNKKFSELSEKERVEIYKSDPDEYRRMRDNEQGK